jgi:hypothetical protein
VLARVAARVRCGHTCILFPESYWARLSTSHRAFPLRLYYGGRRAYVLENHGTVAVSPGSEILSVNGVPLSEIVDRFLPTLASDGPNETFRYHQMNLKPFGLFPGYCLKVKGRR